MRSLHPKLTVTSDSTLPESRAGPPKNCQLRNIPKFNRTHNQHEKACFLCSLWSSNQSLQAAHCTGLEVSSPRVARIVSTRWSGRLTRSIRREADRVPTLSVFRLLPVRDKPSRTSITTTRRTASSTCPRSILSRSRRTSRHAVTIPRPSLNGCCRFNNRLSETHWQRCIQ